MTHALCRVHKQRSHTYSVEMLESVLFRVTGPHHCLKDELRLLFEICARPGVAA